MWTVEFWKRSGERAVKTFAQVLSVLLVTGGVAPDVLHFAWLPALGMSAGGALVSVLTSIGSGIITDSPSLLGPQVVMVENAGRHADPDGDGRIG